MHSERMEIQSIFRRALRHCDTLLARLKRQTLTQFRSARVESFNVHLSTIVANAELATGLGGEIEVIRTRGNSIGRKLEHEPAIFRYV